MFVSAYGAEARQPGARARWRRRASMSAAASCATSCRPIQRDDTFMQAFLAKAPMNGLVQRIPVKLILNAETGIPCHAVHAQSLVRG
jgi:hypothetical protein